MTGVYHCNEGAADYVLCSIRFPAELLPAIDAFAELHQLSRNSAVVFFASAFVDSGVTGRRVRRLTRGNGDR